MNIDYDHQFWDWVGTLPPVLQGHIRYGRDHKGEPIKMLAYICWQAGKVAGLCTDR